MAQQEQKIWIDVSDLKIWTGHHTGIQRVVYNLSKRYATVSNVRFVVFNDDLGIFVSFNFGQLIAQTKGTDSQGHEAVTSDEITSLRILRKLRNKTMYLSHKVRSHLLMTTKKLLPKKFKQLAKLKLQTVRRPAIEAKDVLNQAGSNDVFLVLGGYWGNRAFMPHLLEKKQQKGFKLIHVVYDLIPILAVGYVLPFVNEDFELYIYQLLQRADGLVAISGSTKDDIQKIKKINKFPFAPVSVLRLGDSFTKVYDPVKPNISLEPGSFILCVGTIEVRKNHALLYYAIKEAKRRNISLPQIVVVGKLGWLAQDIYHVITHDEDTKNSFLFLHDAGDEDLSWLYQNCLFTVYPALYEGWGLPIAESLFYGKMCVASDTTSLPEIGGDLIDYFSPFDSAACLAKLILYCNDKTRKTKEEVIKTQYKTYSWDDTFAQFDAFVDKLSK